MDCSSLIQCIHECIAHGVHGKELANCILMMLKAR